MKQSELKLMIIGDILESISLIHDYQLNESIISVDYLPMSKYADFYGTILTNNDRSPKTYLSLDRATQALRKMGYKGIIEIRDHRDMRVLATF